jgi:hypothetical protein
MTLAIRFTSTVSKTLYANGRTYSVTGGSFVDVPYNDALAIQDQATRLMVTGATADRPANDGSRANWPPTAMFDTTLNAPIFLVPNSNPASWVKIDGTSAELRGRKPRVVRGFAADCPVFSVWRARNYAPEGRGLCNVAVRNSPVSSHCRNSQTAVKPAAGGRFRSNTTRRSLRCGRAASRARAH